MNNLTHDKYGQYRGDRIVDPNRVIPGRPMPARTLELVSKELADLQDGYLSLMEDELYGGASIEEMCALSRRIAKLEEELKGLTDETN